MASLTLKNIPEELIERIKELAERERRSMTQQVLYMLEESIAKRSGRQGEGDQQAGNPGRSSEEM